MLCLLVPQPMLSSLEVGGGEQIERVCVGEREACFLF